MVLQNNARGNACYRPCDPARAFFASTTITLKSGERVHVTEQPTMVRCMAYNPLWMIDT